MSKRVSKAARSTGNVLAICGGVGGGKLALGLYLTLAPQRLIVAVNTGDDFEHLGLSISPDVDTVLYTLAGVADRERGWGRARETWNFMAALGEMGGETWFQLGDRDLAIHVERTRFLREGKTLSDFIAHAARQLGISARIMPMTDDNVRTFVEIDGGELPFQRYFVERRCAPAVRALRFAGAERARPTTKLLETLADPALRAVVICPSNPYLSIGPFLAMPELRQALAHSRAPVIVVSPIIAGQAVKGPTAKIMTELGIPVTNESIAARYRGLADGLVIDNRDSNEAAGLDLPVLVTRTRMLDLADRKRLAQEVITFADEVAARENAVSSRRHAGGRRA
ncbi:MAG: 2-phospho-L-lactate transferase [Proteobacteria bacterium]|nr:2-phospho-L-lactate transferase [Pseudomonadota bacterium]